LKSKKWTAERFAIEFKNACCRMEPEAMVKIFIKAEPMPDNGESDPELAGGSKAPRFLQSDGDLGAVMALFTIKVFEHILFDDKLCGKRSIKHMSKSEAMDRVAEAFKFADARLVEGDGSAWDTCCSLQLRNLIENPILVYIMHVLT